MELKDHKLYTVISDITGLTGRLIAKAIFAGEQLVHDRIKARPEVK